MKGYCVSVLIQASVKVSAPGSRVGRLAVLKEDSGCRAESGLEQLAHSKHC